MSQNGKVTYPLDGLTVSIDQPQVITEGLGHCWFPRMVRTTNGEINSSWGISFSLQMKIYQVQ